MGTYPAFTVHTNHRIINMWGGHLHEGWHLLETLRYTVWTHALIYTQPRQWIHVYEYIYMYMSTCKYAFVLVCWICVTFTFHVLNCRRIEHLETKERTDREPPATLPVNENSRGSRGSSPGWVFSSPVRLTDACIVTCLFVQCLQLHHYLGHCNVHVAEWVSDGN